MSKRCPYCGHTKIIRADPSVHFTFSGSPSTHSLTLHQDFYKCSVCGLHLTELELNKENEYAEKHELSASQSLLSANLPSAKLSEETILRQAWDLMQKKKWNKALKELFTVGYPLRHPLEFMIYRNICQAAPLLVCSLSALDKRYQQLNIINHNLTCLNYYLPDGSDTEGNGEASTLRTIFNTMMLLGSLPVVLHAHPIANGPIYYTHIMRAAALSTLADFLELSTVNNSRNNEEYLKLAVQLLHKCLESAQEKTQFSLCRESRLYLPIAIRKQILARIQEISSNIRLLDRDYTPLALPPKVIVIPLNVEAIMRLFKRLFICTILLLIPLFYILSIKEYGKYPFDAGALHAIGIGMFVILEYVFWEYCWANFKAETKQDTDTPPAPAQFRPAAKAPPPDPLAPAGKQEYLRNKSRCLYCGKNELLVPRIVQKEQSPDHYSKDINGSLIIAPDSNYKCGACGICCSSAEIKAEKRAIVASKQNKANQELPQETVILPIAWQLMQQKNWDRALELLYRPLPPFAKPMEMAIYRNICQAALTFSLSPQNKGALSALLSLEPPAINVLKKRYDALAPLAENVKCIAHFLPPNDKEQTFAALKHYYEVFQLFGSLPLADCSHDYSPKIIDYTNLRRLDIVQTFAALLESQAENDSARRAGYLSMAIPLLEDCLTVTLEKNGKLQKITLEDYLPADNTEQTMLEEKIQRLRKALN
ncbi:MAG: hypothetical protein Q4F00_09155 [bacterium]|nr:hypothetical protein [bacterium]